MNLASRFLTAPAAALLVLAAACGAPAADEPAAADNATPQAVEVPPDIAFSPETMTCEPHLTTTVAGSWQTAAPRSPVGTDAEVRVALRDAEGSAEIPVQARVTSPDGTVFTAEATAAAAEWAETAFPADYTPTPEEISTGVYTVLWYTTGPDGETFVSCDGFELE
ncbi:hypothetical protein [Allonocardiopsis opalescens]|uniref:hypothetical protein n=1 Tax=Allonocardiopsis opalescens TaxID=1144618 RepID=UPI000D06A29A|nr:hypothetical protein [Allonocardiopsis opalescens]